MIDLVEFIIYLFFLTPTFFAFFLMFSGLPEERSDWGKIDDK